MNFAISFFKIGTYGACSSELIDAIEASKKKYITRKFIVKPSRKKLFYAKSSSELAVRAHLLFLSRIFNNKLTTFLLERDVAKGINYDHLLEVAKFVGK